MKPRIQLKTDGVAPVSQINVFNQGGNAVNGGDSWLQPTTSPNFENLGGGNFNLQNHFGDNLSQNLSSCMSKGISSAYLGKRTAKNGKQLKKAKKQSSKNAKISGKERGYFRINSSRSKKFWKKWNLLQIQGKKVPPKSFGQLGNFPKKWQFEEGNKTLKQSGNDFTSDASAQAKLPNPNFTNNSTVFPKNGQNVPNQRNTQLKSGGNKHTPTNFSQNRNSLDNLENKGNRLRALSAEGDKNYYANLKGGLSMRVLNRAQQIFINQPGKINIFNNFMITHSNSPINHNIPDYRLSPPPERSNFHLQQEPEQLISGGKITDDMILKFQKTDTVLNYALDKMDDEYSTYLALKVLTSAYFTEYTETLSPVMHKVSRKIINLILDQADTLFSREDIQSMYLAAEEQSMDQLMDRMTGLELSGESAPPPASDVKGLLSFKSFSLGSKNSSMNYGLGGNNIKQVGGDQGEDSAVMMDIEMEQTANLWGGAKNHAGFKRDAQGSCDGGVNGNLRGDTMSKSNLEHIDNKLPQFCKAIKPIVNSLICQLYCRPDSIESNEEKVFSEIQEESDQPTRYDTNASVESQTSFKYIQSFDMSILKTIIAFYKAVLKCKSFKEVKNMISSKEDIMKTLVQCKGTQDYNHNKFSEINFLRKWKPLVQAFGLNLAYVFMSSMIVCGKKYISVFKQFQLDVEEEDDDRSCLNLGSELNLSSSLDFRKSICQRSAKMSMFY